MAQMKAIRVEEFGEPEVLRHADVERPSPGEGEVLLEVRSAGVNYADTMRRRNQYLETQDLPFTPGSEVAGTVAEVGEGVEDVAAGDRVVTLLGTGGYAEYALVPARSLIPLPEALDFDQAAAIPLQGLTAYHCIKTSGALKEGESVLVHAAAGGVGTLSVQMAKLLGAGTVIATASSANWPAPSEPRSS
jgi:NADPH:quinone reductase